MDENFQLPTAQNESCRRAARCLISALNAISCTESTISLCDKLLEQFKKIIKDTMIPTINKDKLWATFYQPHVASEYNEKCNTFTPHFKGTVRTT